MKTKPTLFVASVAGLAAILAWSESRFARQAAQAQAVLSAASTKTAAALREADARLTAAEKDRVDLQAALDALSKPPSETPASEKKASLDAATAMIERSQAEAERQKDPQVQLRQLAAARTKLETRYGALYWKLRMTTDRIEQFEILTARRDEQDNDLMAAVLAQGISITGQEFGKLYMPLHEKIESAYQAEAKALLGEVGYQQFNDYERELSARKVVQSMAGAAVLAGTPFSPQEAEQLVGILTKASGNYRKGFQVQPLDIEWEQADERAREILSKEQMSAFQTIAPSTGGTGRAWLQFNRVLQDALAADRKASAAAKPAGG